MDYQKIKSTLLLFADKFPAGSIDVIAKQVEKSNMEESQLQLMLSQMKDPTISLILSVLLGGLGVDRFMIGDIGLGVGKLLTGGGCGIWWLIDLFLISEATRNKNYETLMMRMAF